MSTLLPRKIYEQSVKDFERKSKAFAGEQSRAAKKRKQADLLPLPNYYAVLRTQMSKLSCSVSLTTAYAFLSSGFTKILTDLKSATSLPISYCQTSFADWIRRSAV